MTAHARASDGPGPAPDDRVQAAIERAERLGIDLPWETNGRGQLIVNPPVSLAHAQRVERIAAEIRQGLPGWRIWPEVGIHTEDGLKAPDLAVARPGFEARTDPRGYLISAPALCVEVMSPSNSWTEMEAKARVYRAAGAVEVWICEETGRMRFVTAEGEAAASTLLPAMPSTLG